MAANSSSKLYPLQELNCGAAISQAAISNTLMSSVADLITCSNVPDEIITNLNKLELPQIKNAQNLQNDICAMLNELYNQITTAHITGRSSFHSYTRDYSGFADSVHFDTVRLESYISFVMNSNDISARVHVVLKNGLASWSDLFEKTITHTTN